MIDKTVFGLVAEYARLAGQPFSLSGIDHIRNAESLSELLENSRGLRGERAGCLLKLIYQLLSWSRHQCELDNQVERVTAGLEKLISLRQGIGLSHGEYIKEIEAHVLSVSPEYDKTLLLYVDSDYSRDEWIQDGLLLYGGCNEYKSYMKAVTKLNYHNKNIFSLKNLIAGLEDVIIASLIELI